MVDGKFYVSFYVDIELLPKILNNVLPVGVFEFRTEFVHTNGREVSIAGDDGQLLALPSPTSYQRKGRKPGRPQGRAAQVIRRVLAHMPEHKATNRELGKALIKAGLCSQQTSTITKLLELGEIKRIGWGIYALAKG